MQSLSRWNKGYKYLLTCIGILSKYAWVIPLKSKTGSSLLAAFRNSLQQGRKPETLGNFRTTTIGCKGIRQCASVLLSSMTPTAAVSRRRYQEVLSSNLRVSSTLIFRFLESFGFFIVVDRCLLSLFFATGELYWKLTCLHLKKKTTTTKTVARVEERANS